MKIVDIEYTKTWGCFCAHVDVTAQKDKNVSSRRFIEN